MLSCVQKHFWEADMKPTWKGVYPAVTTAFRDDGALDAEGTGKHVDAMVRAGMHGIVVIGTVGECSSLSFEERLAVVRTAAAAAAGRAPVIAGVAHASTAEACRFAAEAERAGADGLMVLPPMVYKGDGRETLAHVRAVARSSRLGVLVYNNPPSYGVDLTPPMIASLADEPRIEAVKESSDNPRRITDLANVAGDRFVLMGGVDDLVLESVLLGAQGWISGLVNAFPDESLLLWTLAREGRWEEARALYRWYTPLLHLDTHPKLVQYIKLAMAETGRGTETVRAPRLALEGAERREILELIRTAIRTNPAKASRKEPSGHGRVAAKAR
jgi:4-hydroxy-tetrahydrodipicolinate synthase